VKSCAISQFGFLAPDWAAIKEMDRHEAADAVAAILASLDKAEKQVFAARGMALLLIEELNLWEGRASSMGQWIRQVAPNSWSDCYAAMRTVRELLPDVPLDDLKDMKRCNVETIKKLSSTVRRDPKVIEAAKTKPHLEFLAETAKDHPDQHLSLKSKLEEAVKMCEALEGCGRKQAEEIIGEFYISENAVAYEELLEMPAEETAAQ
jgi:hypothetical protein